MQDDQLHVSICMVARNKNTNGKNSTADDEVGSAVESEDVEDTWKGVTTDEEAKTVGNEVEAWIT